MKTFDRLILVVALCLGLSMVRGTTQPVLAAGEAISGVVTDASGNPLANITVTVYRYFSDLAPTPGWAPTAYGYTDGTGAYTIPVFEPATYRVGFADPRFYPEFYVNAATVEEATDIVVESGKIAVGIDAVLATKASISGIVTDLAGNPAQGVEIRVYHDPDGDGIWQSLGMLYPVRTNDTGYYSFVGLEPGTYRVEFTDTAPGERYHPEFYDNAPMIDVATNIVMALGEQVTGIDAQLTPNTHMTGHVTDPTGNPVAGVRVSAFQYNPALAGWFAQAWTDTDATGNYDLAGLAAGVYRVEFTDASFNRYMTEYYDKAATVESAQDITVANGATVSRIDATLTPLGHITGRVTDHKGNPLQNIQVTAYRDTPAMGGWFDYSFATTDADGRYDLHGFEPGRYRVRFIDNTGHYVTEFYKNAPDINHADDIEVAVSELVSDIDAKLRAVDQPTDKPTITIIQDAQPESKRAFSFVGDLGKFQLVDSDNPERNRRQFTVDAGTYTVQERTAGRWPLTNITCDPEGKGAINLANNQVTITVQDGDNVTCTFTNQKFATIRARVYHDQNGDGRRQYEPALAGWTITVYDAVDAVIDTGVTNQFGKANFNQLRASHYAVCETLLDSWHNTQPGTLDRRHGQPCYTFDLAPGETAEVYFGNNTAPAVSGAQTDQNNGLLIYLATADDNNAEEGAVYVDQDLNTPVKEDFIYLPLITR